MSTIVLKTERLQLRSMNKNDMKNIMEIFSDPEAMRYYPSTKKIKSKRSSGLTGL